MSYHNWNLTHSERIATLTLKRPEALNTLTPQTLHELRAISQDLAARDDIWAVVVQSEGPHFSAGVDVSAIAGMIGPPAAEVRDNLRDLQGCLDAFEALPQMKIARLRGHCIGGGLILALCCDFRLADRSTRFQLPEVQLGIPVLMGTQRLTRVTSPAIAHQLILLAQPFDAAEAHHLGIVTQVTEPDALDDAVAKIAERLANLPPKTLQASRKIIDAGATMSLQDSQELEISEMLKLLGTDDFHEGVNAFREKRPPRFSGR